MILHLRSCRLKQRQCGELSFEKYVALALRGNGTIEATMLRLCLIGRAECGGLFYGHDDYSWYYIIGGHLGIDPTRMFGMHGSGVTEPVY